MYFNHPNQFGIADMDSWHYINGATLGSIKQAILLYLEITEARPEKVYVSEKEPNGARNKVYVYALEYKKS